MISGAHKALAILAFLALSAPPAEAAGPDPHACDDGSFQILAPSAELADAICTILLETRAGLAPCGLVQTLPIDVEVLDHIPAPPGPCLAHFDCDARVIRVLDPARFAGTLDPDEPYALLPEGVLLKALLTHELAHALAAQSAGPAGIETVDQEYIAAAMELQHMDPAWREVLLRAAPVSLPPRTGLIDLLIYGLAPRKFATNAWQHFSLAENGCGLVRRILSGDVSFDRWDRP